MIKEILTVKDQLSEKFRYLILAPVKDPEGRDSLLRFSRKTKEQYVTSEEEGKATSWRAYFQDGRWVESDAKAAAKKAKAAKASAAAKSKKTTKKSK